MFFVILGLNIYFLGRLIFNVRKFFLFFASFFFVVIRFKFLGRKKKKKIYNVFFL